MDFDTITATVDDRRGALTLNRPDSLNPLNGHTLREIGEMFSLTRERVRQIERNALAKISAAEHEVFGTTAVAS